LIRAVGVPALGAAPVDPHVQLPVSIELVDAEESDLGRFRMARALRRVQFEPPEATAVAHVLRQCELLVAHHDHVVVEPRAVNDAELSIVERADIDAGNLGGDLWSQAAYPDHALHRFFRSVRKILYAYVLFCPFQTLRLQHRHPWRMRGQIGFTEFAPGKREKYPPSPRLLV